MYSISYRIIPILVSPNSLTIMPRRNNMITVHESNTNSSKNTFQSSQQNTTVLLVSAACERAWTIPISNSIKHVWHQLATKS